MAAKKTKTTKPYGNKTKFVMGLPRELSAKQVVEKAKQQGITITEAHVYKIRSTAKSKPAGKSAGKPGRPPKSAASGDSSGLSKREFVLRFGPETPASEILRKAKEAGLGLSKAYLYTIRSSSGASQKRGGGSSGRASTSSLENQFIDAAIDMGLAKASELLERLRARLKQGL
jgi:hypothetical protein